MTTVLEHQRQAAPAQPQGMGYRSGQVEVPGFANGQRLRVATAPASGRQVQLGALFIEQVHRARTDPGSVHQMAQHPIEHAFQLALPAQRQGDCLEAADGAGHAAEHPAQLLYFGHPRCHPHFAAEIEIGQAAHLFGQLMQRAPDALAKQAAQQQQHGHQHRGPQHLPEQHLACACQQLLRRHGNQHLQVLPGQLGQLHAHAVPSGAVHLIDLGSSTLGQTVVDLLQAGDTQFGHARQAHRFAVMHDDPLQVRVGHHAALVIDHGDLGTAGHAQVAGLVGQVIDRDIHAEYRRAIDAALGHGHADFTGGEEHVGPGQHRAGLRRGVSEPRPRARVVVIVRHGLAFEQGQRRVIKAPLAYPRPTLAQADTLHQEAGTGRRGKALKQLRVAQAAHQQKFAIGVADIGGAEHLVGLEALDQLRQPLQALVLVDGNRVEGQQADAALHRVDQAPGTFVDGLANLLRGIAGSGHQGLTDTVIALPGQAGAEQQHTQHDGHCYQQLQGNTPPGVAHGWLLHERPMHTLFAHRRPAAPAA